MYRVHPSIYMYKVLLLYSIPISNQHILAAVQYEMAILVVTLL